MTETSSPELTAEEVVVQDVSYLRTYQLQSSKSTNTCVDLSRGEYVREN
jgi:hypothetical protein